MYKTQHEELTREENEIIKSYQIKHDKLLEEEKEKELYYTDNHK